jgi:glycerophosphoryl diester phosphodiesterase
VEFIAHRAGNSVEKLVEAEAVADVVELDVHLGVGGRVEVRHAKLLWPTRRLWDRWYLLPRTSATPSFDDIVLSADPSTSLWLDLKGFTRRLSRRALVSLGDRPLTTVSTKSWWILRSFADREDVRTIRSAGNRLELALMLWMPTRVRTDGVVLHHRLLSEAVIDRLSRRGLVFTWAVDDVGSIERLATLGVSGVILDDLSLVAAGRVAVQRIER